MNIQIKSDQLLLHGILSRSRRVSSMEPDLEAGPPATAGSASIRPEVVFFGICLVLLILALIIGNVFIPTDTLVPTFSVDVARIDGGLDAPRPPPSVNATFGLTLHGVSRRRRLLGSVGMCQESGTVAVSYAGAVLAWGHVPKFCVPKHGEEHVRMVALGADVGISDELSDRMAAERLSRIVELDVDIKLDESRFLSCRVKLDEPSPQTSPCRVLAVRVLL
ncbi:hypothetical protein ACP4OV_004502 [Aristida adscensionis]